MADITIRGNIGKIESGNGVVRFSVCENFSKNINGEWKKFPSWFDCKGFKEIVKKVTTEFKKGDFVTVRGTYKPDNWIDATGKTHDKKEVFADSIELTEKPKRKTLGAEVPKSTQVVEELPW